MTLCNRIELLSLVVDFCSEDLDFSVFGTKTLCPSLEPDHSRWCQRRALAFAASVGRVRNAIQLYQLERSASQQIQDRVSPQSVFKQQNCTDSQGIRLSANERVTQWATRRRGVGVASLVVASSELGQFIFPTDRNES